MRRLIAFELVSIDGYMADEKGDMSWAHRNDPEWNAFVADNASGGGMLLFGRVTYEMMASFWPTPMAHEAMPVVAENMGRMPKVVFSTTLEKVSWQNTRVVKHGLIEEVRRLKAEPGPGMAIMGSGSLVTQLGQEGLIDELQIVVNPVALGSGKALFAGARTRLPFALASTRVFGNGNVLLAYRPA